MTDRLTDPDVRLLIAIAHGSNGQATALNISNRLGYRPSRKGIPAVTQMCRSLNRRFPGEMAEPERIDVKSGNVGQYLVRIPPRDQWSSAVWCITKAGCDAIRGRSDIDKDIPVLWPR